MKPEYMAVALLLGIAAALLITFGVWVVREIRAARRERMMHNRYIRPVAPLTRGKQKEKLWQIPFRRRWRK